MLLLMTHAMAYFIGNSSNIGIETMSCPLSPQFVGPPKIVEIQPTDHRPGNRTISLTGYNLNHGAQISFVPAEIKYQWPHYEEDLFPATLVEEKSVKIDLKRPGNFMVCYKELNQERICFEDIVLRSYES